MHEKTLPGPTAYRPWNILRTFCVFTMSRMCWNKWLVGRCQQVRWQEHDSSIWQGMAIENQLHTSSNEDISLGTLIACWYYDTTPQCRPGFSIGTKSSVNIKQHKFQMYTNAYTIHRIVINPCTCKKWTMLHWRCENISLKMCLCNFSWTTWLNMPGMRNEHLNLAPKIKAWQHEKSVPCLWSQTSASLLW